ncbi:putative UDP-glucuronosyl/UDP-glucosyltransferase [Helianthus annuus]|uniref:UDP-glucuronosyl/UDP-glucosyltransferase n=1 Tax=Helianthus annuus TaxID=4232 RepID=A0A251V9F7_HELAN|nr:UDP-glycosyltransferase 76G1 [Helianthus annuus]KAF5813302.1 putative UDP-glucuronosyl/UDP-glucosyltransferase [Helianthus annuus]KAJ0599501.1 putative UDP-glucuronosyl/UDP-glucosyltransferase [Helianthus annuus]KAJ0934471.1 putative UDP-glucuronosyl/UDP-glucosyltransferase [Helianthus annuus]KAJ0942545.1 putative UDP-glucuronosyl/UDP-glucosyltransferase [Helianthus annuus]
MKNHEGEEATHRRIILFPLPVQGHLSPMLQLANILHTQGFKITIIHVQQNPPNYSNYPHFTFKPIADGFSDIGKHMPEKPDPSFYITYRNEHCADSFRDCLAGLLDEPDEPPVACLITDAEYYITQEIADSLKVPRVVFWACTIVSVLVYRDLSFFYDKGYFNLTTKDPEYEEPVPEYPLLKVKDVIKTSTNPYGMGIFQTKVMKQVKASSGIIWNSFKEPEEAILKTLSHAFPIPRFTLGPLPKYLPSSTSTSGIIFEQDRTFFSWLDTKAPKSVIYVSFGSIAGITKSEFQEAAYGLVNIDIPFLWVVRPGMVKGSEWIEWLPENFLEEVGDRGRIVKWCPQKEVLAHEAIGCFWTHSGWNSTLESICEGVPMICSPCIVGQPIIARYVSDVWKIGILLEDGLEREGIKRVLKRLMLDKEGEEIRCRINALKDEVNISFREGGSSHRSLQSLVDYILSF